MPGIWDYLCKMKNIDTKIIATIGPSSVDPNVFLELMEAGVDYVRINTAYGDVWQYDQIVENVKKAGPGKKVQIIFDIKGTDALKYALEHNINIIALSFAEDAKQIEEVRSIIPNAFVISKIESEKGVENFDAILDASDGIMVARGDLGTAVSLEKVPPLQKYFTHKALAKKKMLIAATEMLLSMIDHEEPTRAEVSDVASAVFDHASAVMLSEETAIGRHPVKAVQMMRKIIEEAEKWNKAQGI